MRKLLSLMLATVILLAVMPGMTVYGADIIASGECGKLGDNLTWILDSEGTLTISGIGAMEDWTYSSWYSTFHQHRQNIKNVIIEKGVTSIGGKAFWDCYSLVSMSISNSVMSIGYSAFRSTRLTNVTIPDGVTSIGDSAFYNCHSLTSVNIPNSVTSIGVDAFGDCTSLTRVIIPDSVTTIGDNAFGGCSSLTSVSISNSITSIRWRVFHGCTSLTSVTIPNNVISIGEQAFSNCTNLNNVSIGNSVTSIGEKAFSNCTRLNNVNIGNSVKNIGNYAFYNCRSLTNVIIPDSVTSIGNNAFSDCRSLTNVTIPDGVTNIGGGTFDECTSLTRVTIPDSVTNIDRYAFAGCTGLTSVGIGNSVKSIGYRAFDKCNKLTDVYYSGTEAQWNNISIGDYNDYLLNATIHYNSTAFSEVVNNVTINGRGTAYGWFRTLDKNGNTVANKNITYYIDGAGPYTGKTDNDGYICVEINNVTNSKSYTVHISGDGLQEIERNLNVTVKPIEFSSTYEATTKLGASVGIGIGVGGSIGNLEAEAEVAKIGADGSNKKGLSITQEYKGNKNKLSITARENSAVAISAKAGLFAGAKATGLAGVEASVGDVSGKASLGTTVGVTYEDDDFNINDTDDVWNLSKFMLSVFLDNMNSNAASRYVVNKLINAPVSSYSRGNTASLSAGANLGIIEADVVGVKTSATLGGIDASSVFSYSAERKNDNSVKYKSSITTDAGYKLLDISVGGKVSDDYKASTGTSAFGGSFINNALELQAKNDGSGKLSELALISKKNDESNIFWTHKTRTDKYKISFKDNAANTVADKYSKLCDFSNGNKGFFGVNEMNMAVNTIINSNEQGLYSTTHEYEQGLDFDISASIQLLAKIGGSVGLSGIEGYEYESESGFFNNNTIYLQSQSDIEREVNNRFISVGDIINSTKKEMADFLSSCWDSAIGWIGDATDSMVKASQAAVGWVGNQSSNVKNWFIDITHPTDRVESMSILAIDDEVSLFSTSSIATTVGNPYIISVTDESGTEVTDFTENPLLLMLEYTQAQLNAAGISDIKDIAVYYWDEDRCVYVYMGGELDRANMRIETEIIKPGQYILAADNCPPAVTEFKTSDNGSMPNISAVVSDLSGIVDFNFMIDGETVVNMDNLKDYYDFTTAEFIYPITNKLAEGAHTAEIYAADSAGNELNPPAMLRFTINNKAPSIDGVSELPNTISGSIEMSAQVSGDDISSVLLNIREEDALGNSTYTSYVMTKQDGEYSATVENITSGKIISVWVSAYNTDGNSEESKHQRIISAPADGSAMLVVTSAKDNCVEVKPVNYAMENGGKVILAVYDSDGELIQALTKNVSDTVIFENVDINGYKIKVMLWNSVNEMSPLSNYTELDL
ncbi:MAG: leucine-rich repeat domain-containing protein [Oscillospiraceae bacterium]|nr:leucine-rich repeat domain-containing protein [Oscillospiraceae bacterium]